MDIRLTERTRSLIPFSFWSFLPGALFFFQAFIILRQSFPGSRVSLLPPYMDYPSMRIIFIYYFLCDSQQNYRSLALFSNRRVLDSKIFNLIANYSELLEPNRFSCGYFRVAHSPSHLPVIMNSAASFSASSVWILFDRKRRRIQASLFVFRIYVYGFVCWRNEG